MKVIAHQTESNGFNIIPETVHPINSDKEQSIITG
jgi:hypothetical protein